MNDAFTQIMAWHSAGQRPLWIAGASLVALSFVIFNAIRIFLYVPQLRTCWNDTNGCSAINLGTWSSWIFANLSTAIYMGLFQQDAIGAVLNAGNACMCAMTVAVTLVKRRKWRTAQGKPAATATATGASVATPTGEALHARRGP